MRHKTVKSVDRQIFKKTAQTKKKINLNPGIYRGGIRL